MADRGKVIKWLAEEAVEHEEEEVRDLAHTALLMLEEQEARVMTREELKSIETWNQNTPPYLWVEDITGRDNRWNYWRAIRAALNLPGTMGVQNYGSVWRVWNLKPTPEQMRDTKWEGDSDAEEENRIDRR